MSRGKKGCTHDMSTRPRITPGCAALLSLARYIDLYYIYFCTYVIDTSVYLCAWLTWLKKVSAMLDTTDPTVSTTTTPTPRPDEDTAENTK
jgi:hypothetical protein